MKREAVVAIVGKPNVGKSTLFNRIVGSRSAITYKTPGVTRDRLEQRAEWNGVPFILIDTGGFSEGSEDPLEREITERVKRTVSEASVVIFLTDVDTGPTAEDEELLRALRPHLEKTILVVNKVENDADRWSALEFHRFGMKTIVAISALHGTGVGELLDGVVQRLPRRSPPEEEPAVRIAVIGKPNVGKSSLVNALIGEDRHIVSEEPGTTRDVISLRLRHHDREVLLLDTAGIKRRSRTERGLPAISSLKSLRSVKLADVTLVVIDAAEEISRQDVRVAAAPHKERTGVIILLNKWDLVGSEKGAFERFTRTVREEFAFLSYAPILTVSALTGLRVNRILPLCFTIQEERSKRIPTAELNRLLARLTDEHPPSFHGGGTGKMYYCTQTGVQPPTFTLFVNRASYFPRSYIRYLNNGIRKTFTFQGTIITLALRSKEK
jgi:GTP-binding protein